MVEFEAVSKVYEDGTRAVDSLDLSIAKGEFAVLIGPSGCGKTTSLKMVNRLEECTEGRILVDGRDIQDVDPVTLRRNIGYVVQDIALMPHLSVGENIATVPRLLGWKKTKIDDRVDELLAMAGLEPKKYRYRLPEQLSGGQKQRIGVLRALAADPDVILMDEPFGALDPLSRDRLQTELLEMQKSVKKTIVFVTHDMNEALKMADRVILMRRGKVEQMGSPVEIQTNPVNDFVRTFLGEDRLAQITPDMGIESLVQDPYLRVQATEKAADVLSRMEDLNLDTGQVVDDKGKWIGMVVPRRAKALARDGGTIARAVRKDRHLNIEEATISDAAAMLADMDLPVPVLDGKGHLLGIVDSSGIARLAIGRLCRKGGETR
ncbi:ABC transporter ATP-binding protein [Aminirod propionatiphilus]|uniref:Betaine/proline/choline family ABC transporter ATP-binding protein n=1 Tax=Aminirod propionatiphilus TaxID=3415223 RepID=A0ACD1DVM5_9BACT|nr:betaine/proline/choline family ABC transporter ATP-binding protein [Synergistota bacterium]